MAHFYLDERLTSAEPGELLVVQGSEAHHIVSVSRTRVGEDLLLGNGRGLVVGGEVQETSQSRVVLRVSSVSEQPASRQSLALIQALAKGDRDELAIQAATELGADVIVPWQSARSVSRWQGQKADRGRERWAGIVREATKQSMRPWLPQVEGLATTSDLAGRASELRMLVLDPEAEQPLTAIRPDARNLAVVVGPEGGISPEEIAALTAAGAEAVRLGDTVLRTSSAGPAAIAVLNAILRRW